jgi:branched-chain amino acid transport system permease protein
VLFAIFINGLLYGGTYALLAVGFALVFGVAKVVNMSHTGFYMMAAYLIFIGISMLNMALSVSTFLALVLAGLIGIIAYRICLDRIKSHETAVMIVSVALAILIQELLLLFFGAQYRTIPPFISGFASIYNQQISYQSLLAIVVSALTLVAVWLLLSKTMLGIAIRAVADNREAASLMGFNVARIGMIIMGISVVLAAVASSVAAPIFTIYPTMWMHPLVTVLAAVILGGLGSIKGSLIGALILGFAESIVVLMVPKGGYLGGAVSLCIMIVILMIRPEGLFGIKFEEERL